MTEPVSIEAWLADAEPGLPTAGWDPKTVLDHALALGIVDRRCVANALALVDTVGRLAEKYPDVPYAAIADAMLAGALPEALPAWARAYWWQRARLLVRYRPEPVGWRWRRRGRRLARGLATRLAAAMDAAQRGGHAGRGRLPPGAVVWEPRRGDDDWSDALRGE